MVTIHKYQFSIDDEIVIEMPTKAQILSVQIQNGIPCIWAMVNTANPVKKRKFYIRGTGQVCEEMQLSNHIGTIQMQGGQLVFHIFAGLYLP